MCVNDQYKLRLSLVMQIMSLVMQIRVPFILFLSIYTWNSGISTALEISVVTDFFFFFYSCLYKRWRVDHALKQDFTRPAWSFAFVIIMTLCVFCSYGGGSGAGTLLCYHWWKPMRVYQKYLSLSHDLTSKTMTWSSCVQWKSYATIFSHNKLSQQSMLTVEITNMVILTSTFCSYASVSFCVTETLSNLHSKEQEHQKQQDWVGLKQEWSENQQ